MTETWDCKTNKFVEMPKEMIAFLDEIKEVCLKYDLSISHEDGHGSFIIERYSKNNLDWLSAANKDF